jgi:copper homeostasis protein
MSRITVEICIESVEDAAIVAATGGDRVELCSTLALGGLTPSVGAISAVRQTTTLPIMAMIRPRAGGFCYSHGEFTVMRRDIDATIDSGADGIVLGVLLADGRIDIARSAALLRQIEGAPRRIQTVFHRAFDFTPDAIAACSELIDLGFTRVLTSGQSLTASQGAKVLRALIEHSACRIEILPAGAIRAENVTDLLAQTGAAQIHASVRHRTQLSNPEISACNALAKSMGEESVTTSQAQLHALLTTIRNDPHFA